MGSHRRWASILFFVGAVPLSLHGGVYISTDVPKPIWDLRTTISTITVPPMVIGDVNVIITELRHSYLGDLEMVLRSPSGTYRRIVNYSSLGSGRDMLGTIFDDSASVYIHHGTAPFTGSYKPAYSLDVFIGENAGGVWSLSIQDLNFGNTGWLYSWALEITPQGGGSEPEPVPEPATALLVATGLAAAALIRRRVA